MDRYTNVYHLEETVETHRTIFHLDMDAFFASVEQACDPRLRGQPILVCGAQSRTVVLSPSYEARAYGVKTGMTVPEAQRLCPSIICVPADNAKYTDTCCRIVSILQDYTPLVEVASVDEAFLDVTGSLELLGGVGPHGQVRGDLLSEQGEREGDYESEPLALPGRVRGVGASEDQQFVLPHGPPQKMPATRAPTVEALTRSIKKRIHGQFNLSCSIGVAPNKLLAKLGSRMKKPDGLVIIRSEDIPILLEDLPVKQLCGIGPGTEATLATLGIRTCGELGRASVEVLRTRFGIMGERLHQMGLGIDDSPVLPMETQTEAKGIGHSMTLSRDIGDREVLNCYLLQLSEKVGRRMRREGYRGRIISITLRYKDFTTFTRQHKCVRYLDDGPGIFKVALEIFNTLSLKQPVRLVGVSISGLVKDLHQLPLFDEEKRRRAVLAAMDQVNDRYGEFCITWGTLLNRYPHEGVISPAWKPKGPKRY
ncbi:MAG: DNA polymerase IV [Nitrospira sp.]|nr:DNA polymerase IV [Nitrospira sp.]